MHVMAHVCLKNNSRLVCDPSYPEIYRSVLKIFDWSDFYRNSKEVIPMNAPEIQGIEMFVDSDYAGDKVSHRSRNGLLKHVNTTLVQWLSKKQST